MAIYPVIMCGGAGTRLWPASRPTRPKQFLNFVGAHSLFQETARRVAPMTRNGGSIVVVCGSSHCASVEEQLREMGLSAVILLEPEARDSAPAMAAAAAWIAREDAEGVAVFVASDHYLPDAEAFCAAAERAAEAAAQDRRILTLGVRPTEPSSAYGYIRPEGEDLSPVAAFIEKPDAERARSFIDAGYYWNSGNFVTLASTLIGELETHAPDVIRAAVLAVEEAPAGPVVRLGDSFLQAPKISIDYAVMEKTASAWVLPVAFEWSDLGAWDAVAATGSTGHGLTLHEGEGSCFVRAADGMVVATVGVKDIAVIAEHDAVLVCDLRSAQQVKAVVDRLRSVAPSFLVHGDRPTRVPASAEGLARWLHMRALPLWFTVGQAESGRFAETLTASGADGSDFHRARVPARQIYSLAVAGRLGWRGPWRSALAKGLERYWSDFARDDGQVRGRIGADGASLEETAYLYDQAFALLALASAFEHGLDAERSSERARRLLAALELRRLSNGGWREDGERPFQSNAHMHLFEAALAWEALEPSGPWTEVADAIVALTLERFIDPDTGALREFFSEDWSSPPPGEGFLVEPGHQFEWAWLLARFGQARGREDALSAARRLYACGVKGIAPGREVACDELNADLTLRSARARLWPQTEWLKAALLLGKLTPDNATFARDAERARRALAGYLLDDGRWRDKQLADGSWLEEPAPASSLYHIITALAEDKGHRL